MKNIYRQRAFRLLAQDAHLDDAGSKLLLALMAATPVALRGYATMVPMAELVRALASVVDGADCRNGTESDVLAVLEEVEAAYWSMPSLDGPAIGSFLNGHALSRDSGLLHFQIDNDLIAAIERIGRQLQPDSNEPPEVRH